MIIQFRRRSDAGARIGPNGLRSFKRQYNIKSNTADELRSYILNYPAVPAYGSPHPEDWTCTVSDYDLNQLETDPYRWILEVTWSTQHNGRDETDDQKQPDMRRPKWSAKFQPVSNFLPRDRQGKLFCDSAGTLFDPPPDQPIWVRAITIQRYESIWAESRDLSYINACNSDVWRLSEPCEVLISDISVAEEFVCGNYWMSYTYTLLQNPFIALPNGAGTIGGWDPLLVVNAGPKVLDANGKPTTIVNSNNCTDGRPLFLDGTGHATAVQPPAVPVMLQFHVKKQMRFKGLNLIPPWDPGYTPWGTSKAKQGNP